MRQFLWRVTPAIAAIGLVTPGASTTSAEPISCELGVVDLDTVVLNSKAGQASLTRLADEQRDLYASFRGRLDALGCKVPFNWPIPDGSFFGECVDLFQIQLDLAEAMNDLDARREAHLERLSKIKQAARLAAARVGEALGCALVTDPRESPVLWTSGSRDITAEVREELDATRPAAGSPAA